MSPLNRNLFSGEHQKEVSITIIELPPERVCSTLGQIGRSISTDHLKVVIRCKESATASNPIQLKKIGTSKS